MKKIENKRGGLHITPIQHVRMSYQKRKKKMFVIMHV